MMLLELSVTAGHCLGEQTARKPAFLIDCKYDPSFKVKRRTYFVEGNSHEERKKKFN